MKVSGRVMLADLYPNHKAAKAIKDTENSDISYDIEPISTADLPTG